MRETQHAIVNLGNHIVFTTCGVLEKHWVHGEALKAWREGGMR